MTNRMAISILLALTMACGESPTQPPGPPASVAISPSTLSFTAIGEAIQLVGHAYDAVGNEVATGNMFWTSADHGVVQVSPLGLVTSVGAGETTITGSLSSGINSSVAAAVVQIIAVLEISEVEVELGALTETRQLSISAVDAQGVPVTGRTYSWSSSDDSIVTVSSAGLVTAVANGVATVVGEADGVRDSVLVTVAQIPVQSALTPAFSFFESTGSSFKVGGELVDSLGYPVEGSALAWSSSDPTVATVTPNGVVTVVGTGSTGIFARSRGFEGAAAVTVGSASDWSAAGEWLTYQGDEAHTGYVPVDLDVGSFAQSWSATPVPGEPLNSVTIEGSDVAYSTNTYLYRTQQVGVLSVATGTSRWMREFPEFDSVHPPAIRDGTVYVTTGSHVDSYLWAFDATSGDSLFASSYKNQFSRYLAPVVTGGKVYMAGGYAGGMYRFDATTGAEDWFVNSNQIDEWTPAVKHGRVYAYTVGISTRLQVVDADTGLLIDQILDPGANGTWWSMAPVIIERDRVVVAQGNRLLAFDPSGGSISWQVTDGFGGQVTAAEGVLYVTNDVMNKRVLEARREADGSHLWSWAAPGAETVRGPFVATRNVILVSTDKALYAVHVGSHEAVWKTETPGKLALGLDGHLYVVKDDRIVQIAVR